MNRIDWSKYLAYFSQINTRQTPASEDRRTEIEDLLVEVLEISGSDCPKPFGTAGGFGNGTEVVVHLNATPRSGIQGNLAAKFAGPLAIRVMREDKGDDAISFFQQRAKTGHPLNGPEHVHFQRSLGVIQRSGYNLVIHEWVPGETLEWLRENYWNTRPLSGDAAQEILRQIVFGVVIPSWAAASDTSGVLWDIRDANFVVSGYEAPGGRIRVAFVDTGNLRHLIKSTENRKGQIHSGLSRLRNTMKRILMLAQGKWEARPKFYEREFELAFKASGLADNLSLLPDQEPPPVELAEEACHAFLNTIREQGFLRPEP
jgi:serine/threonine protein kinase